MACSPIDGRGMAPLPIVTLRNSAHAAAAAVAAAGRDRYTSPLFIIAQTMRAILLASATAATLRGLRFSRFSSQAEAMVLPGRSAAALRSEERRVGKECRSRWS